MDLLKMKLLGALVGLSRASEEKELLKSSADAMLLGLAMVCEDPEHSNERADSRSMEVMIERIHKEKLLMSPDCASCQCPCGRTDDYDMEEVLYASESLREAKLELLDLLGQLAVSSVPSETSAAEMIHLETAQLINDSLFQVGCTFEASQLVPWTEKVRKALGEVLSGT